MPDVRGVNPGGVRPPEPHGPEDQVGKTGAQPFDRSGRLVQDAQSPTVCLLDPPESFVDVLAGRDPSQLSRLIAS